MIEHNRIDEDKMDWMTRIGEGCGKKAHMLYMQAWEHVFASLDPLWKPRAIDFDHSQWSKVKSQRNLNLHFPDS